MALSTTEYGHCDDVTHPRPEDSAARLTTALESLKGEIPLVKELTVGTLIDSSAKTYFLGVSKDLGTVTLYGGYAQEESKMTVSYIYEADGSNVTFDASAKQEDRFTLGAALGVFNVEMGMGDMTTYSAGVMFGF